MHTQSPQPNTQFNGVPVSVGRVNVANTSAAADSDTLTRRTTDKMRDAIQRAAGHPIVIRAVVGAMDAAEVEDWSDTGAIRRAVWNWVRNNIRFVQDDDVLRSALGMDDELELLIEPPVLLSMASPAGDCDDFTMLTGAMLLSAGIPSVEVVTICADPTDPRRWSHVYLDAGGVIMDCSHGEWLGWEAPQYYSRRGWGAIAATPAAAQWRNAQGARLHGYGMRGVEAGSTSPINTAFNWGTFAQSLVEPSFKLATQITQRPGQYVQGNVVASNIPGAVPIPYGGASIMTPVGSAVGEMSTGTLLLLGGAGLLLVAFMVGGRR